MRVSTPLIHSTSRLQATRGLLLFQEVGVHHHAAHLLIPSPLTSHQLQLQHTPLTYTTHHPSTQGLFVFAVHASDHLAPSACSTHSPASAAVAALPSLQPVSAAQHSSCDHSAGRPASTHLCCLCDFGQRLRVVLSILLQLRLLRLDLRLQLLHLLHELTTLLLHRVRMKTGTGLSFSPAERRREVCRWVPPYLMTPSLW